jgi:hypothetical protein
MIQHPIHVERVGEIDVRYFRSPRTNRTGVPDMPWHACDDLWAALEIEPHARSIFLQRLRADWGDPETVASPAGLVVIAPFIMGDIMVTEWLKARGVSQDSEGASCLELRIRGSFRRGNTCALKAMTSGLSGPSKLAFALAAMEFLEDPTEKEAL